MVVTNNNTGRSYPVRQYRMTAEEKLVRNQASLESYMRARAARLSRQGTGRTGA